MLTLSCPGKIFILGEYTCLVGGRALVHTSEPRFELSLKPGPSNSAPEFAPESPAGLLARELSLDLEMQWKDPHTTPIGVGSSSAQFLLMLATNYVAQSKPLPSVSEVLEKYWSTTRESPGLKPSGVDLLAQWLGGPLSVRNNPLEYEKLHPWPADSGASFLLAFTGAKTKTHEHLADLTQRGFPSEFSAVLKTLDATVTIGLAAWSEGNAKQLGAALTKYQEILTECKIAPQEFSDKISTIGKAPGVYGAKCSGAQGGDCVLVLFETERRKSVLELIEGHGWTAIDPLWTSTGLTLQTSS